MSTDTRYAYAVARIRAIEKKLIGKEKINRMVDARSVDEAFKVLVDAEYGYSAGEISSAYEYEKLLKEEYRKLFGLLKDIAPQPDIFNVFLLRNDYHNAKVILKSEFSGNDDSGILIESGSIPVNKLKIMIRDRKLSDMSGILRQAIEQCIDVFNRTGDPQIIDLILDKAAYSQMIDSAKKEGNGFLTGLIKKMIDLTNIKIFLRVRNLKKSWDFLQKVILSGGFIDSGKYVTYIQESLDNVINIFRVTQYGDVCEEGIGTFQRTGSFTELERLSDNHIINYIRKALYIPLGIEPLIAYLIAKENEIKNVRIVMVGKINNIDNEIIKERLRETYV